MKSYLSSGASKFLGPLAVVVVVLIVYAIYAPGRYGAFILDDFVNLGSLVQVQSFSNVDGLLRYVFSDTTGLPAGRWVSKLSFLINDTAWPSHPFAFKYTNILIHIINGLLVIWLVLRLMRLNKHEEHTCQLVAILTGSIWLLHPLNVSTALYVVQRMNELSTLFTLVGILFYLTGRQALADNKAKGYMWITTGVVGGTLLAFLSKENGALLPLYILVIEMLLLRDPDTTLVSKYWKAIFLWLPVVFLISWHVYMLPAWIEYYALRPFDLSERLLTQARILVDYITSILLPTRRGTGVFQDDYLISHGLLDPPATLLSVFVLSGMVAAILLLRRKLPVLSFGIAWFFVGHVLESGIVPLELYFEHRNYLPMVGPLFAVCYYALTIDTRIRPFIQAGLAGFLVLAAVGTWQNVQIWASPAATVEFWEREHPSSPRTLEYASNFHIENGNYDESQQRLHKLVLLKPDWAGPKLKLITLSCISGSDRLGVDVADLAQQFETVQWDPASISILNNLLKGMKKKPCHILTIDHMVNMVDALIDNPSYQRRSLAIALLHVLKARIHQYLGDSYAQAENLQEAFQWQNNWHVAVEESRVWASLGEYDNALDAVDRAKSSYYVKLRSLSFHFDSKELDDWEKVLKKLNNSQRFIGQ